MKRLTATAASLLATLLLTGCTAYVYGVMDEPTGRTAPAQVPGVVISEKAVDPEAAEEGVAPSPRLGDTVWISDWEVTVTALDKRADKRIEAANQPNDKPEGGYLLVDYTARYIGDEPMADARRELRWCFIDADGNALDPASVMTPADADGRTTEAPKEGTIEHQVVFDVDPDLVDGGIVSVVNFNEDTGFNEYADFPVG